MSSDNPGYSVLNILKKAKKYSDRPISDAWRMKAKTAKSYLLRCKKKIPLLKLKLKAESLSAKNLLKVGQRINSVFKNIKGVLKHQESERSSAPINVTPKSTLELLAIAAHGLKDELKKNAVNDENIKEYKQKTSDLKESMIHSDLSPEIKKYIETYINLILKSLDSDSKKEIQTLINAAEQTVIHDDLKEELMSHPAGEKLKEFMKNFTTDVAKSTATQYLVKALVIAVAAL